MSELTARPEKPATCVCRPAFTPEAGYRHSRKCEAVMARRAADAGGDVDGLGEEGELVGSLSDYRRIYRDAVNVGNMPTALAALNMIQQLTAPEKPLSPEQRIEHERASFAREIVATLSAVDGGIAAMLTRLVSRGCVVCAGLAPDAPAERASERSEPSGDVVLAVDKAALLPVETSSSQNVAEPPERAETSWERLLRLEATARERMQRMQSANRDDV